jgi:hypothetical protein
MVVRDLQVSRGKLFRRSLPLFGLYQNLFAISIRSTYLCDEAFSQLEIIKSKYRSRLTDELLKYRLHLCLSTYEPPGSTLSQTCRVMDKVYLLIMINNFSLKRSIFNEYNNCTFICLILLG